MKRFPRRLSPFLRAFLLYVGLSVALLLLPPSWTGPARHAALWPYTLAQRGFTKMTRAAGDAVRLAAAGPTTAEVKSLRERLAALEAALARESYLRRKAEARLEHFMALGTPERGRSVLAALAAYDPSPLRRRAVFDRGSSDGIARNCPVLWRGAVLGRVVSVGPASCTVALIGDPNCRVAVRSVRTQVQGVLEGLGGTRCVIKYVERTADVRTGDRFVTSGLDGIFPPGYLAAICTEAGGVTGEPHKWVEARPACDPRRIEEAAILLPSEGR